MSDLLAAVGQAFTSVMSMVGNVASAIAGGSSDGGTFAFNNPVLLLFCVAVPLCGIGVGMFKRLLSARG